MNKTILFVNRCNEQQYVKQQIKMILGGLMEETERERQRRKCQLYRQILDNQILIDKKYKADQIQRNNSNRKSTQNPQRTHSSKPNKNKHQQTYSLSRHYPNKAKDTLFPIISDKNNLYKGASKYFSLDHNQRRNFITNKMRTEPNQEIQPQTQLDGIIYQLQTLNKNNSNRMKNSPLKIKQRRLLNYKKIIPTNQDIFQGKRYTQNLNIFNNDTSQISNYQSRRYRDRFRNRDTRDNSMPPQQRILQTTFLRPEHQKKLQILQKAVNRQSSFTQPPQDYSNKQMKQKQNSNESLNMKESLVDKQMNIKRQNFLQILKKVKNRGQSLIIKLSKYPSSSHQNYQGD